MKITNKEVEAMEIAGFGSVSELLNRYFDLVKDSNKKNSTFDTLDVIAGVEGKINFSKPKYNPTKL